MIFTWNSGLGDPTSRLAVTPTVADIKVSPLRKNNSLPSLRHTGQSPPSEETFTLDPDPEKGWTKTSDFPDWSET